MQVHQEKVEYLRHIFAEKAIKVNKKKVLAVKNKLVPKTKQEIMSFLGMVTYQIKLIPEISRKTAPLRDSLEKDIEWQWMLKNEEAMKDLKDTLTKECDSSKDGLKAVLQKEKQPVAYATRTLFATEHRYAQIKKVHWQ